MSENSLLIVAEFTVDRENDENFAVLFDCKEFDEYSC